MKPEKFEALKENIISQLRSYLLPGLFYHSADHTLDVLDAAEKLGIAEKISAKEIMQLKIAALFHDSGYLFASKNHEERSCRIARLMLPGYDVPEDDIDRICELIMATQVPHHPKNKLEEIMCDADLDYLGREDFFNLSKNLFLEMKQFQKVFDERTWNEMQIKFFELHKYFTNTAKKLRAPVKEKHLAAIKALV